MFLLPIISTVLMFILIYDKERNFIKSIAITWLTYAVISWAANETLGWFYIWTKATVALVWLVVTSLCVYLIWRKKLWESVSADAIWDCEPVQCIKRHKFLAFVTAAFFVMMFGMALLRSPNNTDSLVYHLPRIRHWIQNQSVRPYATTTNIQVRYPTLAEYMISQIAILGAHDRLFNLYQTAAYFVSGMLVYAIGRKLQVSKKIAFISVWFFWTIPMACAQAFSTQTDDIACTFLLIYIYFLLDFIQAKHLKADRQGLCEGVRLAACVMLGYLCKPTIGFAMVIFFIWMCVVRLFRKDSWFVLVKYVIVGAFTALIMFTPSLIKVYDTFAVRQTEQTEQTQQTQQGEVMSVSNVSVTNSLAQDSFNVTYALKNPEILVMTCVKNIARNSYSAYFTWWNDLWIRLTAKVASLLEYDDDVQRIQRNEEFWGCDTASAPAIMVISILMGVCFILRISRTNREKNIFVICAILSFFTQCALMGYTNFRTRYLVGVMALLAISAGIVLDNLRVYERSRLNIGIWLAALCTLGWINTYYYESEQTLDSLTGDSVHKYLMSASEEVENLYRSIVDVINGNNFTSIGIQTYFEGEYILWQKISGLQRLESVNVNNNYGVYEDLSYHPECIIQQTRMYEEQETLIECHGIDYIRVWSITGDDSIFSLYVPAAE